METIIFATKNMGKMKEIKAKLPDYDVKSMEEVGIDIDVDENGSTFEDNAILKAEAIMKVCNKIVVADDSGLEIDYLNKAPGVLSARYLGHDTSYDYKNSKILEQLEGVPEDKRTARFVCAMAVACPNKETKVVRGTIEGIIGYEIKGDNGFGFDPIFIPKSYNKTMGELSEQEKNSISHRGIASEKLIKYLKGSGVC